MPPSESDARQALRDHLIECAVAARRRHGPAIDADAFVRLLDDCEAVRYPTGFRFDTDGLRSGEFAYPIPLGDHPSRGFCLVVHPAFSSRPEVWPLLLAYYLPTINYGDIVTPEDCEQFAAALLGIPAETYYRTLCALADSISDNHQIIK